MTTFDIYWYIDTFVCLFVEWQRRSEIWMCDFLSSTLLYLLLLFCSGATEDKGKEIILIKDNKRF